MASLGDIPDTFVRSQPRQDVNGKLRDVFSLVLQSLCMDLQNSNGKLLNLVFLKNCSMLVLKLENLIQNRRALIAVSLLLFYSGARASNSSLTYKTEFTSKILWNSDQNFWSTSDLNFAFCNHSLLPFLKSRCCFKLFFVSNLLNLHYLSFKMSYH